MKKEIKITGVLDEEKEKIELEKSGLCVPHLIMTITALTQMLFNDLDEEGIDKAKVLLKDVAENPEEELKNQFLAIRAQRLTRLIRSIKELIEDDEKLN